MSTVEAPESEEEGLLREGVPREGTPTASTLTTQFQEHDAQTRARESWAHEAHVVGFPVKFMSFFLSK